MNNLLNLDQDINMPVLILGVGKPYRIEGKNGPDVEGCAMHYLSRPDTNTKQYDPGSGEIGLIPTKQSMPVEFYNLALNIGLPSQAIGVFGLKTTKGGPTLYLKEIKFDNDSDSVAVIEEVEEPAAQVTANAAESVEAPAEQPAETKKSKK